MDTRKMASGSASSSLPSSVESLIYNNDKEAHTLRSRYSHLERRPFLFVTCACLAAASLFTVVAFALWTSRPLPRLFSDNSLVDHQSQYDEYGLNELGIHPLDPLASLKGPPTASFRDNLRDDTKYITSWISAGWTNDVMTYGNLIYLGLITDRVPIIPQFTPSHIGGHVPPISFGQVFDLPRLRRLLGKPVLEWLDVKNTSLGSLDELGCWNLWESVQYREAHPRGSVTTEHLKLDISYTKTPSWTKLIPGYEHDQHSTFWSLATLAYPETRAANLVPPLESPYHHVSLPPDEHLLCYDYLYYVCAHQPFEYEFDYSPAWRRVGQHMHWVQFLEDIADTYIRSALQVEPGTPTPPYIAIHVRHADFSNWCGEVPVVECFASLPVIARRVNEVKEELLQRKGVSVDRVIMTSDERDNSWWEGVVEQGWVGVDHSRTVDQYGEWYPVLIDAVIQSNGVGFVGTDRSTMSMMARRRVESWHDGVVRTVKWGRPDSDDH